MKLLSDAKPYLFCLAAFIALIWIGAAGLTSILSQEPEVKESIENEMDVNEHHLKLSDGRTVLCIETTRIGSWSCDWEGAK